MSALQITLVPLRKHPGSAGDDFPTGTGIPDYGFEGTSRGPGGKVEGPPWGWVSGDMTGPAPLRIHSGV